MKHKVLGAVLSGVFMLSAISGANASLILNVTGISGAGVTTWALSGSSTVNLPGTIRTSAGSSDFDTGDSFEPDLTGNFIANGAIQDTLFAISGTPTIMIGGVTQTITHIFLDDDGSVRDDVGIRTDVALAYAAGEASSWSGVFTVALDINNFNPGSYRHNSNDFNGDGFLFAGVGDVTLNFASVPVPEPASLALFGLGLAGLGLGRRRKAAA